MNIKRILILIWVAFLLSRIYILLNPPLYYSDVFQDYRRYAAMWSSGLTPYLVHLYEYPPATIPVLYLPEWLNLRHLGHYYENYRLQIFVFDVAIFSMVLKKILKLKIKPVNQFLALGFYLVAPVIAKDFFYDGLDWLFIGSFSLALIYFSRRYIFWFLFWLSTGIKLLTAPLMLVLLSKSWKPMVVGLILVWGLPLIWFRSSLSVMWVYNNARGIKYAAFPSFVVETIDKFTHTEIRRNEPPDFELVGPVSAVAESVVGLIFPLSILLVVAYGRYQRLGETYTGLIKISLIYFFTIFFTAKIFSQPFHLWYVPLIALYPFKSTRQQLTMMSLALILLVVDTTPWIRYPAEYKLLAYLFLRYLPLAGLLWQTIKLPSR